jgi:hypothetical protein
MAALFCFQHRRESYNCSVLWGESLMKFWFCETCGKRLTDQDLDEGNARDKKLKGVYCSQCAAGVLTMETMPLTNQQARELLKQEARSPEKKERPSNRVLQSVRKPDSPDPIPNEKRTRTASAATTNLWIAACAGLVLLLIPILLLGDRNPPQPATAPKISGESPAVALPPPPAPQPIPPSNAPAATPPVPSTPQKELVPGPDGAITLQEGLNGYTGVADIFLSRVSTEGNKNGRNNLDVTNSNTAIMRVILIRFAIFKSDGGPVPGGAKIDSATLSLYQASSSNGIHKLTARRLLVPWSETEATGYLATSGAKWNEPCANGAGTDMAVTADGDCAVPSTEGWHDFDVTAGVQAFASGNANHGWRVCSETLGYCRKSFVSSESSPDSQRPRLTIRFRP